jgi:hypothetical protein
MGILSSLALLSMSSRDFQAAKRSGAVEVPIACATAGQIKARRLGCSGVPIEGEAACTAAAVEGAASAAGGSVSSAGAASGVCDRSRGGGRLEPRACRGVYARIMGVYLKKNLGVCCFTEELESMRIDEANNRYAVSRDSVPNPYLF